MAVLANHETSGLWFPLISWKESQDGETRTGTGSTGYVSAVSSIVKHRGLRKDLTQKPGLVVDFKVARGSFHTHTNTHTHSLLNSE